MLIYESSTSDFIGKVRENKIADILVNNFTSRFGRKPSLSEIYSFQNSLPKVRDLLEIAGLKDNKIVLEYEIPFNQCRIDCLLFGKGQDGAENVVLIELKQWSSVKALSDEGNFVETYTGHAERSVPHPSQQVEGYSNYLKGFLSEFDKQPPLPLFSCVYCHNYKKNMGDGLFNPVYKKIVDEFPIYTQEDTVALANKLKSLLAQGDGFEVFNRFMQSPIKPSKKLLDNVAKIVGNEQVFSLLNEQILAKNLIWSKVKKAANTSKKSVIIVNGGPGTGKSVIALNILADAALKHMTVFYGCKSKPFIEGLKNTVGKQGELLFSNLYRFVPSKVKENQIDLLLVDEAHRIEKTSNFQWTKPEDRTDMPQIDQLIRCSRTSVFFIDNRQNVRSQEIGHSGLIYDSASKYGADVSEVTLETQYRCMGSNDYLLWIESILGYSPDKRMFKKNDSFDFKIFNSPQEIYSKLLEKEAQKKNSARITAGYCWPWSNKLNGQGELVKDVVIGDFAMPWETPGKINPPDGYVRWYEWAYKTEGIKQVGCIYTAQGFEFDYAGVIIGKDLIYNYSNDTLTTDVNASCDPMLKRKKENAATYIKNIYRTLLTRGMKGCYVYFCDKDTEKFFRSRMEA